MPNDLSDGKIDFDAPYPNKRIEAVALIQREWYGENDAKRPFMQLSSARRVAHHHKKDALNCLQAAIRETKAQELAEALEHITDLFISLKPLGEDAEKEMAVTASLAAIASYKELANG